MLKVNTFVLAPDGIALSRLLVGLFVAVQIVDFVTKSARLLASNSL